MSHQFFSTTFIQLHHALNQTLAFELQLQIVKLNTTPHVPTTEIKNACS